MKTVRIEALLKLIAFAVLVDNLAFNIVAAEPMRPVTEQEFFDLYNQGLPIQNRVIPAYLISEIVQGVEQTHQSETPFYPLKINNSTITGNLRLNEGDASREVLMGIEITNTTFAGEVVLYLAHFHESASFSRCVFMHPVNATEASFDKGVSFPGSVFKAAVLFERSEVSGDKAYFLQTTFHLWAMFTDSTFKDGVDFQDAKFLDEVNLSANFDFGAIFADVVFSNVVVFREHRMNDYILFIKTKFLNDAFFEKIKGPQAHLDFSEASFHGRMHCTDSELQGLSFSPNEGRPPSVFEKSVDFHSTKCEESDFHAADFRDYVNFSQMRFLKSADFTDVSFGSDVNFYGARFGEFQSASSNEEFHLKLDGVRFEKTANLRWGQLIQKRPWWCFWQAPKLKILTVETDTWKSLQEAFGRSGNLEGENEAMYQRRLLARTLDPANKDSESTGWKCFGNHFSECFWGYGVRPARLGGWILFFYLFFTGLYWTQTKQLAEGKKSDRLMFAMKFSVYTSLKPFHGYKRSSGKMYKSITLLHYFVFTIMWLCFLDAISRISPLLHNVVGKLFPI